MCKVVRRIKPAYFLIAAFAVMLALGLLWGGFGKVFANAAVICLDCIGLI
jgi:hypothetical protein